MAKKTHTLQVRVSDELAQRLEGLLKADSEVRARFPQLFVDRSFNRATLTRLAIDLGLRQLAGEAILGESSVSSQPPVAWLYPEEGKGSVIALTPGAHRIGRDPAQADVVVADKRISRLHCALFVESSQAITIVDFTEAGRTFINGRSVDEEQALHPGDVIGFSSNVIYRLVTKPSARPSRDELATPVVRAIRDFSTETIADSPLSPLETHQIMVSPDSSAMREFLDAIDRLKPQMARVAAMETEPTGELQEMYQAALRMLAQVTTLDEGALSDREALVLARKVDEVSAGLHQLFDSTSL